MKQVYGFRQSGSDLCVESGVCVGTYAILEVDRQKSDAALAEEFVEGQKNIRQQRGLTAAGGAGNEQM